MSFDVLFNFPKACETTTQERVNSLYCKTGKYVIMSNKTKECRKCMGKLKKIEWNESLVSIN